MPTTSVRRVVLGTAGHIDHGKTTLVERLTGVRTDRLPEEQERGMTIDVGYAAFTLPDGAEVGLLDVPGHERLVRTMVAGATAMDLALLVVAADDGPMPQTREHVAILDVLGVDRLVVALTKVDLADDDMIAMAEAEIRDMLAPTRMTNAPILRVSSETNQGIDALKAAIAAGLPPPREDRAELFAFRMPVLRAFVAPGRGTVVTGIPLSGRVAEGETLEILPPGWRGKVRSIQVHHREAREAFAHQRVALALSDVDAEKVRRGMVVATAGVFEGARRLAARVRLLADAPPIEHRERVRLHVGADQSVARVHVLEGRRIESGQEAAIELETFRPVLVAPGDHLVLRAENASETLGGGMVVEIVPGRLPRRAGVARALLARAEAIHDPQRLVEGVLQGVAERGATVPEIAARTGLLPGALPHVLDAMAAKGAVERLGRGGTLVVEASAFARVLERIESAVRKLHERDRAMASLPLSSVRAAAGRVEPAVLEAAVERLLSRGTLVRVEGGDVRHREHSGALSSADQALLDRVRSALAEGRGQPPSPEDLEGMLRLSGPEVMRALRLLENRGEAFRAGDAWFEAAWLEDAKGRLAAFARDRGGFTPSDARTVLSSTRKWVIPLLEALDKTGFTRRAGEKRVLRAGK